VAAAGAAEANRPLVADELAVTVGGRLMKHARYYWLLLAERPMTRRLFGAMLRRITALSVPTGVDGGGWVAKFSDYGVRVGGGAGEFDEKKGFWVLDFLGRAKLLLSREEDRLPKRKTTTGRIKVRRVRCLGLLGGDEVQTLVKFVNLPSPHPCPLPWGEGGRRPGEGSAALGDPTLGGKRLLATT